MSETYEYEATYTTEAGYTTETDYASETEYAPETDEYASESEGYAPTEELEETPAHIDLTKYDEPAMIDLTDAPTEELLAAKAS